MLRISPLSCVFTVGTCDFWASKSFPRPALQELCVSEGLARSGTILELRSRLIQKFIDKEPLTKIIRMAKHYQHNSLSPTGSSSASGQNPGAAGAASSSSSGAGSMPKAAGTEGGCSVLAQCPAFAGESLNDHTDQYADTRCGPPLPDQQQVQGKDLVEEGEHGILPVAGIVKMIQAFDEPIDEKQVALLLAGDMFFWNVLLYLSLSLYTYILSDLLTTCAAPDTTKLCSIWMKLSAGRRSEAHKATRPPGLHPAGCHGPHWDVHKTHGAGWVRFAQGTVSLGPHPSIWPSRSCSSRLPRWAGTWGLHAILHRLHAQTPAPTWLEPTSELDRRGISQIPRKHPGQLPFPWKDTNEYLHITWRSLFEPQVSCHVPFSRFGLCWRESIPPWKRDSGSCQTIWT